MDADDVAHAPRLALQAERLERDAAVDVLGCRVALRASPAPRGGEGMRAYVEWQNALVDHDAMARDRFVESPLVHPSVAMRDGHAARGSAAGGTSTAPRTTTCGCAASTRGCASPSSKRRSSSGATRPGRLTRTDPRYAPGRFLALKLEALARGAARRRPGRRRLGRGAGRQGLVARPARRGPRGARVRRGGPAQGRAARRHGVPVVAVAEAGRLRGPLHLAAVGQKGARERIRAEAARLGLADGIDLVAVA